MTNQHPITPPPELVQQWLNESVDEGDISGTHLANRAAQWGADQELEACCEWITDWYGNGCDEVIGNLRSDRRPKPPSLKEQALCALASVQRITTNPDIIEPLRRALEQLPE
jgi:hypothetical protein